jgi:hypothetical protein
MIPCRRAQWSAVIEKGEAMNTYRVVPLPTEISEQVRAKLESPQYGHPAHVEIARGYGPCRACLQTFRQGEEQRILFTFNPFEGSGGLPAPGPIFIHRDPCRPYEDSAFPRALKELPLFLEGFGRGAWKVRREGVENADVEGAIERLFAYPDIEYIHVRNAEAGCFIARVERAL